MSLHQAFTTTSARLLEVPCLTAHPCLGRAPLLQSVEHSLPYCIFDTLRASFMGASAFHLHHRHAGSRWSGA